MSLHERSRGPREDRGVDLGVDRGGSQRAAWTNTLPVALALLAARADGVVLRVQAASAHAPQTAAASVLGRHASAVGGPAALAASGDIEMLGRVEGSRGTQRWRLLLRLDPPAMREELSDAAAADDTPPAVFVCSAHRAWIMSLPPREGTAGADSRVPGGLPQELPVGTSVAVTDRLNELRLMLRPLLFAESVSVDFSSTALPAVTGWPAAGSSAPPDLKPGREITSLLVANPSSLLLQAHFDAATGRLIGFDQPWTVTHPWVRLTDWRSLGGLLLPTRRIQGSEAFAPITTIVEDVRTGLSLPDQLFAGDPFTPRRSPADVAPLSSVPSTVPGTGYLVLPEVRANGRPVRALFDTAADGLFLHPSLAQSLQLGTFAMQHSQTLFGSTHSSLHHLARLEIGVERLFQIPAFGTDMPQLGEFLSTEQPQIAIGGWPIMQLNPVLDLRGGRLISRGPRPLPLKEVARVPARGAGPSGIAPTSAGTIFDVPMGGSADERGAHTFFLRVSAGDRGAEVLLDTGFPYVLRLSASGMRRLGLPTAREPWVQNGGAVISLRGAGGQAGADLLVRVSEIHVGPITYHGAYVLLAGLGDSPEVLELPWDGLLGAGALLPFARVGFDGVRGVLELEVAGEPDGGSAPSDSHADESSGRASQGFPAVQLLDGGTRALVGDPGLLLGFFLRPPLAGVADGAQALPSVFNVHPGSSAARAGVRVGDRLVSIDGISVATRAPSMFASDLWLAAGRRVTLVFARDGEDGDAASGGRSYEVTLP